MADDKASRNDLERQSSSDSYQSIGEVERQTANWFEVRIIGSGGFGNVTLWKNKHDGAHLVIKECRIPTHMLRGMEERWHNEINLLSKLTHPNITTARQAEEREFGRALSFPFLCMEYCEGGDLRQVLRNSDNCCGLHETQIREVCKDIANGIKYLHQCKIVHRDLKPENILLKEYNGKVVYKLTDFGYAKQYDQSSMFSSFVGTMQYVAPEILQNQSYNKDVDFWSFGIVVYECITGRRPFLPGDSPMQWLVKVEKKRPDDIAVDWAENGMDICYYSTLPPPHRLSRVFEDGITKWLGLMLRWKPQHRGGAEVSAGEREWYICLEEILLTKMTHVVCMSTGNIYTYPINETDTNMSHIIEGIKEDTGLEYDQQKLLTSDGCLVSRNTNPISRATMASSDTNNSFYLFTDSRRTSIKLVGKETKQITKLITNPDENMSIAERRRCYGVMYSLMRERSHMFTLLLSGYQAMITYLQRLSDEQNQYINKVRTIHTKLQAKLEFLKVIQQNDIESLTKLRDRESIPQTTANRVLSSWKQSDVSIEQDLIKLLSNIEKHTREYSSMQSLVDEFIKSNKKISSLLDQFKTNFVAVAKNQFEKARYVERREELPSDNVAEAQKLLMNSVQYCDQLIERFNGSNIAQTMVTMSRLNKEPEKLEEQMKNHDVQIQSLQVRRQAVVWELTVQKPSTPPPDDMPPPIERSSSSTSVVVSTSVEHSLITFKRQVSKETNDSVLSINNDLLRRLELVSEHQLEGVADSLQLH